MLKVKNRIKDILVIDDEKLMLSILEKVLIDEGFRVNKFVSGESALEYLRYLQKEGTIFPELVIVDYALSGMTGIDFIVKAKEIAKNLKSILISGRADKKEELEKITYKADAFMFKPIVLEQLLKCIESIS